MTNNETIISRASLSLQKKIADSIALVRKAEKLALRYDAEDGFFLAFSGGKDSQALYHIAQLAGVKFKAHFSPTTCDPPQVIRFIHAHYPDCVFHHPKISIYDKAVQLTILPTMRVRWCCAEYKENAGAGRVTLIGIRHAESARRSKRKEIEISAHKFSGNMDEFAKYQEETIRKKYKNINIDQFSIEEQTSFKCINGKDSILVSPIIEWTEKDVWEFLNNVVQVPHCCLYDAPYNQHRIGCILCPMSSHKQKLKDIEMFPHVKQMWLKAIKQIRAGGV